MFDVAELRAPTPEDEGAVLTPAGTGDAEATDRLRRREQLLHALEVSRRRRPGRAR